MLDAAARVTGIGVGELKSRSRLAHVVDVRRVVAYLGVRRAGHKVCSVGDAMQRDGTTVSDLVRTCASAKARSAAVAAALPAVWTAATGGPIHEVPVLPAGERPPKASRAARVSDGDTDGLTWADPDRLALQEAAFRAAFTANCGGRDYAGRA